MSAIERLRAVSRSSGLAVAGAALATSAAAGLALSTAREPSRDAHVAALIKARLPRTAVSRVDCGKIAGMCEVTAGTSLFYVDAGGRYLTIGRIYDMETRQDLTAARLLEINPDLLIGGAAKANAAAGGGAAKANAAAGGGASDESGERGASEPARPPRPRTLSLAGLSPSGAIVWGKPGAPTITTFTDFRCGYCRALAAELAAMSVRVIERPISVLGSRELADRVYCAPDRAAALRAAYAGQPAGNSRRCDTSGLDDNERFARAHGLTGTPVIVRSDGEVLEGFRSRAFLETWIRSARS